MSVLALGAVDNVEGFVVRLSTNAVHVVIHLKLCMVLRFVQNERGLALLTLSYDMLVSALDLHWGVTGFTCYVE